MHTLPPSVPLRSPLKVICPLAARGSPALTSGEAACNEAQSPSHTSKISFTCDIKVPIASLIKSQMQNGDWPFFFFCAISLIVVVREGKEKQKNKNNSNNIEWDGMITKIVYSLKKKTYRLTNRRGNRPRNRKKNGKAYNEQKNYKDRDKNSLNLYGRMGRKEERRMAVYILSILFLFLSLLLSHSLSAQLSHLSLTWGRERKEK